MGDKGNDIVQCLQRLIRFRNEYPAFDGGFRVEPSAADTLALAWRHGDAACTLHVDLEAATAVITYRDEQGRKLEYRV